MIKSRAKAKAALAPMAHQKVSLKHAKTTPIVYDTSDPGTGKTAVAIWDFAERRRKKGLCALVLAPRSLLKSAWADDFKKFALDMTVSIARAENREEAFAEDADVYVTNVDAVKWLVKQPKAFWSRFDTLIVDEITAFKHHTSQRSRAAARIAKNFKYRRGLTGTPNGRSITDVWHQVLLLDDGKRLGPSFFAFRNTVCTPVQVGRSQHAVNWEDKDGAEEAVYGLLSDIVVRHKFEECVDIPAHHTYTVSYALSSAQRKVYETMQRDQIFIDLVNAVKGRMGGAKVEALAINAAAVTGKLLQISSGALYTNDEAYKAVANERYNLILDLVEARKHPLVFFFWKHQRDMLTAEASARGLKFAVIDGTTTDKERDAYVMRYQAGQYDVLFAHPQSAAHGLTLTRGTSTIWPCPTYNLEWFKQGNKRQYRLGQKEKTETIVVIAENTVEQGVYDILMKKDARMTNLLDLFASL